MATGCSERVIRNEEKKFHLQRRKSFHKQRQRYLVQIIAKNSDLDVAFLMDCTSSMSDYINEAKENIDYVVKLIKKEYKNKVRIAFVGYRDHTDGDTRIECCQFTENIPGFNEFLKDIKAHGGKDTPEDVLGGLETVGNLEWLSKIRVMIHIADAPQHGSRFHDLGKDADNYFDEEPRGLKAEDVINEIKEKNIKYFFVKINKITDKMIKVFKDIAGARFIEEINLKSPDLLSKLLLKSLTKSLSASISNERIIYETYRSVSITGILQNIFCLFSS